MTVQMITVPWETVKKQSKNVSSDDFSLIGFLVLQHTHTRDQVIYHE